jgi:hypothetical protein
VRLVKVFNNTIMAKKSMMEYMKGRNSMQLKNSDEPKGKQLSKTKFDSPSGKVIGEQRNAVSKAGEKNKSRQNEAAAAPKPMSKGKKILMAVGAGAAIAGKVAYDMYHDKIRGNYMSEHNVGGGTLYKNSGPYGDNPSNRELRKWKKSR